MISLLALWMTGVAAVLAVWVVRWRHVASIVRAAQPAGDGPVLETLRRLETSVAISGPWRLSSRSRRSSRESSGF